ncbi:MGH1-like glycoside hydrolase domain-containing protein [Dyella tabacisoli]|uniref:Glycoside hydrolase n=1 Tax=Dyella tabacisoli TaxID=2282381 RepID=A0A369UR17_9GAMM|nr:trehalase family glycosidase [Dyella tabacisoli]RDD82178.1 glycoside hydrolase [Dyella tabacisoli]
MRRSSKTPFIAAAALALALAGGSVGAEPATDPGDGDALYFDLLDLHGAAQTPTDRSFNIFFDAGSWHGYSLPPVADASTGFSGPFVHSLADGQWVGSRFAQLILKDSAHHQDIALTAAEGHAAPGYLMRRFAGPGLTVRETLFFADSWHALVRIELTATEPKDVNLSVAGRVMQSQQNGLAKDGDAVTQTFAHSYSKLTTRLHVDGAPDYRIALTGTDYRIELGQPLHLEPQQTTTVFVEQTLVYDSRSETPAPVDDAIAWPQNRARWSGYLTSVASSHLPGLPDETARRVSVKAMMTLLGNWRAARGDMHYDGVIPSYSNPDFNGFWAWDSWKHAAALAHFAPELARDQMRAMFDYQGADGMVPDCIYLDKANNNERDSKPPLAVWAALKIYQATGDQAFLAEMYDKLVRYHRWWFKARDHDRNGLAEYGSTDGTKVAAAWESGMDNAVRFDHVTMLDNGDGAWSMDQESVDLNAYLYKEKLDLAEIAGVLGKTQAQAQWRQEAATMKAPIQARMFDKTLGYFFDAKLGQDDRVRIFGSEGWAPLWAGVASPAQAKSVVRVMLDPKKFATVMPFPTLAADDPRLSPIKGYWRGPVWLDQAYFGVEALRRYGYEHQADDMARRLVLHAEGLTQQAPFYENYDPLTGRGYQSRNFSWSAASYLLLLQKRTREIRMH